MSPGKLNLLEYIPEIQVMVDQLTDAIFVLDHEKRIMLANQSAGAIIGIPVIEMAGKPVCEFIRDYPQCFKESIQPIHTVNQETSSNQFFQSRSTTVLQTKSTKDIPVEATCLHFLHGDVAFYGLILHNLSEIQTARQLQESSFALSSKLNLGDVFDQLLVELRRVIPNDGANFMLVGGKTVHIARALGYEALGAKMAKAVNLLQFDTNSFQNIRTIVSQRKLIRYEDTQKIAHWIQNDVSRNFRSWMGAPVFIEDRVEAIIALDKIEPGYFTETHAETLKVFSRQAASAIRNARLYEAETIRNQQLDSLKSMLVALNSHLELSDLLHNIVERAIQLLGTSNGKLALYEQDRNQLKIIISKNNPPDQTGVYLDLGEGLIGQVAVKQSPMKLDRFSDIYTKENGITGSITPTAIAVPLLAAGELLGVLEVSDLDAQRVFEDTEIDLLSTFAQQATAAIQNSRLFEAAKARAEEAERLRRAGEVITSTLDQDQAVNLILEQLSLVIPYTSAIVMLYRKESLKIIGGRGLTQSDQLIGTKIQLDEKLPAVDVFRKKQSLLFNNLPLEYPDFYEQVKNVTEFQSWLGAPLTIQNKVIGVIALNAEASGHFTQDHLRLIDAFAVQIAIALENARLYTDTARSANRFETLYHLGQTISRNLRPEDIYPAIHEAVSELMSTEFFCIALLDMDSNSIQDVYKMDRGEPQVLVTRPFDRGLFSTVLKTGSALLYHDFDAGAAEESGSTIYGDLSASQDSKSILIVPLKIGNRNIGVLSTQSHETGLYTKTDREMLELLAVNVAIALENTRLFNEVQLLAITDPLTGLFNRRKFEERGLREFERSRRYHRKLCAIMIDLDQFKHINDTYGHQIGDRALMQVAVLCQAHLRNIDTVARIGGEEFAILLPETSSTEAMLIAERLRQDCETNRVPCVDADVILTISLGVVELDDSCDSLEEMIHRADQALYASKHAGRNTISLWTSELAFATPPGIHIP